MIVVWIFYLKKINYQKKIIESVILYNKLSGEENIENYSEEEQDIILQKIEIFFFIQRKLKKMII